MLKDTLLKSLLIPLLRILIPYFGNLIDFHNFTRNEILFSYIQFIVTSYIIYQGNVRIISVYRVKAAIRNKIILKLFVLCLLTSVYSCFVVSISSLIWQEVFLNKVNWSSIISTAVICVAVIIFLTVFYESLFLSKERELDVKILNQLDRERLNAELSVLKSELDPHFLFNALTSLSHLVQHDKDKAYSFIQKLSSTYKYFLINREKDLVLLEDELDFIDNYYYLLKIRFDDNVKIKVSVTDYEGNRKLLPFTLQTLVENAIKHNSFTNADPLTVSIEINGETLIVSNGVKPKPYAIDSTKIGLKNLKARYRLVSNNDITVQAHLDKFIVKLPLIKQTESL